MFSVESVSSIYFLNKKKNRTGGMAQVVEPALQA
jgi:hypothetical protein